jgi:predicted transcriptional regulator
MIKKMKSNKAKIEKMLKERKSLRDSDNQLIKAVWISQVKTLNNMSAADLLNMLASGRLVNPETVRRCRQKIQEENPSLRGKTYRMRKSIGKEMKKDIKGL